MKGDPGAPGGFEDTGKQSYCRFQYVIYFDYH